MNNKLITRIALVACAIALLCMTMAMGTTYSLLSEKVTVKNHLQAGNLDVSLKRHSLEYQVVDPATGELKHTVINDISDSTPEGKNFTEPTNEGIFGIEDYENILIAPGSFFAAKMAIYNEGQTAFDYTITLELLGEGDPNELAKQLQVTVTYADGETKTAMLSELKGDDRLPIIDKGHVTVGQSEEAFTVKVEFIKDGNSNATLEEGQGSVEFDLVVSAVQSEKVVE
ncbi:MAG: hypothetical protein IJW79_01095 [Clostridia bacterium]|nr:hypothetical protein [Clostridia bacterium]